ncbi:hypothetical protein [Schaalia sp. lx-100]|uniref:hypothetical protein n=1 Tax=Schaalia sp. lx-100 TaxID=2899081 RepID=UPI001E40F9B2|nr:hypothetical protein [Schaalia sp. lx-100]MCD4556942.1 hypothetical protein [Schaalia sp. lx-100]
MTQPSPLEEQIHDSRPPALGMGRLVMVLYWLCGLWIFIESVALLFVRPNDAFVGPLLGSVLAGFLQITAAVAITHNGRRMRMIGWVTTLICLTAPIIVGIVSWGMPAFSVMRSAWGRFGVDYWYLPIVVNGIGIVWLWFSNPRRIVELAERIERVPLSHYGSE